MRKDRSSSAGVLEFPVPSSCSPDTTRRNKDKYTGQISSSKLRSAPHGPLVDLTIFHIPGMDIKLQYQSKVIPTNDVTEQHTPDFEKAFENNSQSNNMKSFDSTADQIRIERAFKRQETHPIDTRPNNMNFMSELKGSTSMHGITNPNYGHSPTSSTKASLENLQFGMSVTPPNDSFKFSTLPNSNVNINYKKPGVKKASLFAWMTLQSVPEETIISPHILEFLEQTLEPIPTTKTLNTSDNSFLPTTSSTTTSTNEQDLTNYGNYVYASFPVDVIVYFHMQPSTFRFSCLPVSRVECLLQLPSLDIVFSSKRAEEELFSSEFGDGAPNNMASTAVGGLSVTGCLSDFSVYIFHPYGGKKSTLKEAQWSPLSDSERKDSLSVNVEFVKFHLSRSRMLNFKHQDTFKGKGADQSRAVIRFSTIVDIGSASFKYDMRRLTEILAFPKAWYRRSIVRRMFLGDLSMAATYTDEEDTTSSSNYNTSPNTPRNYERVGKTDKSPLLNNKDRLKLNLENELSQRHGNNKIKEIGRALSGDSTQTETPSPSSDHKSLTAWETLVLFTVNFKKLNVHMNMGNVMGNVT